MEGNQTKDNFILKFIRKLSSTTLKAEEYIFISIATIIEIVCPFFLYYYRKSFNMAVGFVIAFVLISVLFLFLFDIEEFYKTDFVEQTYFQIVCFVMLMLISMVLFARFDDVVLRMTGITEKGYQLNIMLVFLFFIYMIIAAVSVVLYDVAMALTLILYTKITHIKIENPYLERLRAAKEVENMQEYANRMFFEAYTKQNREKDGAVKRDFAEGGQTKAVNEIYKAPFLFEDTDYFKQITEVEQVKPRYHALMKIYHPDNAGNTNEVCQKIQEEYSRIVKKYNL